MSDRPSPSFVILCCLLVWTAGRQLVDAFSWGHESFQLTEWLINYSGGFVRRGLPGWLIGMVSQVTGIQANHLIIVLSAACFITLALWFLRHSARTYPSILILSCLVMGFPAYQDSIVRKDCLGLLLLLGCLKIDRSRLPRYAAIPAINLVAVAAILSHETFVFFALPALVLYRRRDEEPMDFRRLLRRGVALLPAAACFGLVTALHGTPGVAETVNDSWAPLWQLTDPGDPAVHESSAAIRALGWNSSEGLSLGITLLTSGFYQPVAWAAVFVMAFVLFLLFTGRHEGGGMEVKIRVTALLALQLLFISPLFVLGVDYGRWLFLWLASTAMIDTERLAAPRWMEAAVARVFRKSRADYLFDRVPARDWYLLFFGVPVCWNIFNFMVASPISRHLHLVWSWL